MRHLHFYGKGEGARGLNQLASVFTRITSGLNSYTPPTAIDDNMMSDMIDIYPYREEAVLFSRDSTVTKRGATECAGLGIIRQVIASDETTSAIDTFYLFTALAAGWKIIKQTYTRATGAVAVTAYVTTMGSTPSNPTLSQSCSAIFKTEADTYYCFANSHEARLHFVKHTSTADSYSYVDLPASPKQMVAHANRIFFIDTTNKIWWCRGGDLYSWYAMEYDADAIAVSENCGNKALTIAAQPSVTRQLTATVTKTDTLDTYGILTWVGTNGLDEDQTAVVTLKEGMVQTSMAFKTVTSATISGWTQGGASPDTITLGVAPVGLGTVVEDSGYWTLEGEPVLHDMCLLGNAIYIWAGHNIYIFQGTSPDSFILRKIISDVGIQRYNSNYGYNALTVVKNTAYFLYDDCVYEFDGDSQPRIINRPVILHNQSSNGITGGFSLSGSQNWTLASSVDALYLYSYNGTYAYRYVYEYETRTWWKYSGILKGDVSETATCYFRFIQTYTKDDMYCFISSDDTVKDYYMTEQLGITQGSATPFIVTKAYNTIPSADESLTQINLMLQGTATKYAAIELKYSLTVDQDDFVSIVKYDRYNFNGDVEIMPIPVPQDLVSCVHHYRLKLIVTPEAGYPVTLYNLERRFRQKGRSR